MKSNKDIQELRAIRLGQLHAEMSSLLKELTKKYGKQDVYWMINIIKEEINYVG